MDMEQINFTRESVQARADAIKVAGEVAGIAEDYQQTYTAKGTPKQAVGIRGVFGATDDADSTTVTANTHAEAVIAIADFIVTGARD